MNITILGTGHVGLPTGLVFAEWGHNVLCYDILEHVVDQLRRGEPHFFEPGVKESLDDCIAEGRISFTTSIDAAVQHGDTFFITVGTPPGATRYGPNGELRAPDMAYVSDVASQVAKHIGEREVFVYGKSTVPIQTGACVQQVFADFAPNATVHVASNPEFLQEGRAMENGRNPDRVVVGTDSAPLLPHAREVYAAVHDRLIFTDVATAELVKYASNTALAQQVALSLDLARLSDKTGADWTQAREILRLDRRIGTFTLAGPGYGGMCFPKDMKAVGAYMAANGIDPRQIVAAETTNAEQPAYIIEEMRGRLWNFHNRRIAVYGLSFKAGTSDTRESPPLEVIRQLRRNGAVDIQVYDPHVPAQKITTHFTRLSERDRFDYLGREHIRFGNSPLDTADGAHAAVFLTDDSVFKGLSLGSLREKMTNGGPQQPWIFDCYEVFDPKQVKTAGFRFYGVGRGSKNDKKTFPTY